MGVIQKIKNLFTRSKYVMTTQSLTNITDHPKIAISQPEYDRITTNLKYYKSDWDSVLYLNTDGETKKGALTTYQLLVQLPKRLPVLSLMSRQRLRLMMM
ncbi:minor capsid protein [Streptococcus pyogenes JRS4]|nr:minor capsid protein [Streptococcus pyogenes JRS4]